MSIEKMREAFEAWARSTRRTENQLRRMSNGDYEVTATHWEWQAWQAAVPAWQPINTGPVATNVLALWRPVDHEARPFHKEIVIGSRCYDVSEYKANGKFYSGGMYYEEDAHVTHWMPLPPAPEEKT